MSLATEHECRLCLPGEAQCFTVETCRNDVVTEQMQKFSVMEITHNVMGRSMFLKLLATAT